MNIPKSPLYRDPLHDGAADPVIIYNYAEKAWWMLYTARHADAPEVGYAWIHGTDIGIAESRDYGKTWLYRGICEGLNFERGRNTYWAPEVVYHEGIYHMYVSYVRGVPTDWNWSRNILHYTSKDMWDWVFQSQLDLDSDKVIDAAVFKKPDGGWYMWYKNEMADSHTFVAESRDLYQWEVIGEAISDCPHEGPNVFEFCGMYWMITDEWHGMGVYSSHNLKNWVKQDKTILGNPGKRPFDGAVGNHADVLVCDGKAYIVYFCHPDRKEQDCVCQKEFHTAIQVAELTVKDGLLHCDRDQEFDFMLKEQGT